ncbi:hypothetical protein LCGC14_0773210 [marine sediment metagenome]|uniref:Uncharacterized protein n=1 Tax=marine sediment metagenome TaxID=412755 RepID=A0A0F9T4K9_9ZZZZ
MGIVGSILLKGKEIYRTTSDKRHPLGTRGYTRDGRVFRYARNGGVALAVGKLVQSEAPQTNLSDDLSVNIGVTSGAAAINITVTTVTTLNAFAGGYIFVNDGAGEGQMAQILSHTSASTGSTLNSRMNIELADGGIFTTAVSTGAVGTTDSEVGIVRNPYDKAIIAPATLTSVALGVTPRAVAVNYYFWVQTWGPAVVQVNSTGTGIPAAGFPLIPATVAGAVTRYWGYLSTDDSSQSWAGGDVRVELIKYGHYPIGNCMEVGADGETGMVDLKLAP